MKVKILIEFDVEPVNASEDGELGCEWAKGAASMAAHEHLTFNTPGNGNYGTEDCIVHVDGYGECLVKIGTDHE